MFLKMVRKVLYSLEEKLGESILTGLTLLGTAGVVEEVAYKTTYIANVYLPILIPTLIVGSVLYLHANLRKPKKKSPDLTDEQIELLRDVLSGKQL